MENLRAARKDGCGNKFCFKTGPESSCGFGVGDMDTCCLRKYNQVFLCGSRESLGPGRLWRAGCLLTLRTGPGSGLVAVHLERKPKDD